MGGHGKMHACTWKKSSPQVTDTAVGKEITLRTISSQHQPPSCTLVETKDGIKLFASDFVTHGNRFEKINQLPALCYRNLMKRVSI